MISVANEMCVVRTSFSSAIISKVERSFHEAYTFESLELGTNLAPWGGWHCCCLFGTRYRCQTGRGHGPEQMDM